MTLDAITSIRDTYTALIMDLENAIESGSDRVRIGSGPSAAGLVRKLKNYKFVHLLHFLCIALKSMTQLALTFESNNVDLSIVQHTLSTLQQLKEKQGLIDIKILAIILVPLIMTLSRGHTAQIKRTVIMR